MFSNVSIASARMTLNHTLMLILHAQDHIQCWNPNLPNGDFVQYIIIYLTGVQKGRGTGR